jgi:hypothetical protein
MKNFRLLSLTFLLFFVYSSASAQEESIFQYVSPKPNSIMVSTETNIILRHTDKLR